MTRSFRLIALVAAALVLAGSWPPVGCSGHYRDGWRESDASGYICLCSVMSLAADCRGGAVACGQAACPSPGQLKFVRPYLLSVLDCPR